MEKRFIARPYRYADGVPWNEDRYEIFVWENGKWESVGGAIRKWGGKTIAFLCIPSSQRDIRTPEQAVRKSDGLYVWGDNVKSALQALKCMYPNPTDTLRGWLAHAIATF